MSTDSNSKPSAGQTSGFDNFDTFATDYRSIHNDNIKLSGADSDYFSEYKIKEIKRVEGTAQVKQILDLGCGDGNSARFFYQHFPNAHTEGIDISADSIEEAKKRQIPGASFRPYDGSHIPFEDNKFDVCLIATVLHHIRFVHHPDLLREVLRVLKPGGRLYIFEHNPWNPVTRKVVDNCVFDKDAVLLSPPYSKRVVKEAGFRQVSNTYTIFFPRSPMFRPFVPLEPFLGFIPVGGQYFTRGVK